MPRLEQLINSQASAVDDLAELHNAQKLQAISALIKLCVKQGGRIAFCGIGKSHHVAQVTADMFASLGIPALALNGASITHGDSGYVSKADLIVYLTKSGKTAELIAASQCLFATCEPIQLAITQTNANDTAMPNVIIYNFGPIEELNGYSPTVSTLRFIAITNAIAMQCQVFTKAEFIKHHPGGAIGQML